MLQYSWSNSSTTPRLKLKWQFFRPNGEARLVIAWIFAVAVSAIIIAVTYSLAFFLMKRFGKRVMGPPRPGVQWRSNIIIGPVVLCIALIFMVLLSGGNLPSWGVAPIQLDHLVIVIAAGFLVGLVVIAIAERISPTPANMALPREASDTVLYILLIVGLASISEELLFRGVVQNTIDSWYLLSIQSGPIVLTSGAVVSAIIFSLVHSMPAKMMGTSPRVLMASSFILALTAGIALATTGSLIAPILIHAIFNLVGMLMPSVGRD
jgi:membrane protease YdiL (CAAX protease family)